MSLLTPKSADLLATEFATIEGRRVRVARMGRGQPLVLLHGYPDNLQIWSALAPLLARDFEVIAVDWPGLGQSERWTAGATPGHLAGRLGTILDALGIGDTASSAIGPVNLVGLDMGGQPALVFAAENPIRVRRLVVMNSLVIHDAPTSWEIRLLRKFGWNRFILERLPGIVFRRCERSFLPRGVRLDAALRADLWDAFRRPETRKFLSGMTAGYQAMLPRLPDLYANVRCPTLALWGGADPHFPPVHAERLVALVPGARLKVLPHLGHWMPWSHSEEVAAEMQTFLAG